jgi:hypothetical protein
MTKTHNNYVNSKWVASNGGQTYEQRNPADLTEVTGIWQDSTTMDDGTLAKGCFVRPTIFTD